MACTYVADTHKDSLTEMCPRYFLMGLPVETSVSMTSLSAPPLTIRLLSAALEDNKCHTALELRPKVMNIYTLITELDALPRSAAVVLYSITMWQITLHMTWAGGQILTSEFMSFGLGFLHRQTTSSPPFLLPDYQRVVRGT